jgi:hypothetical protein
VGAVDQHASTRHTVEIGMVITRADGTVTDLGTVSAHYATPLKRAGWRLVGRRRANARIRTANRRSRGA